MQNFLGEKTFQETERVKKEVAQYFASKPVMFFEIGIQSERWAKVIDAEGNYFDGWMFHYYIFIINLSLKKKRKNFLNDLIDLSSHPTRKPEFNIFR